MYSICLYIHCPTFTLPFSNNIYGPAVCRNFIYIYIILSQSETLNNFSRGPSWTSRKICKHLNILMRKRVAKSGFFGITKFKYGLLVKSIALDSLKSILNEHDSWIKLATEFNISDWPIVPRSEITDYSCNYLATDFIMTLQWRHNVSRSIKGDVIHFDLLIKRNQNALKPFINGRFTHQFPRGDILR
jgi:hypothetical protein